MSDTDIGHECFGSGLCLGLLVGVAAALISGFVSCAVGTDNTRASAVDAGVGEYYLPTPEHSDIPRFRWKKPEAVK